jgi:hypothetical protein
MKRQGASETLGTGVARATRSLARGASREKVSSSRRRNAASREQN